MSYHADAGKVTLDQLRKRIEETDLVPSRRALLEDIGTIFGKLESQGIRTLADLRKELKNAKYIGPLSKKTGVDPDYLVLLRREVEGYFPKPALLREFGWLDKKRLTALEAEGYNNSALVFEALETPQRRSKVAARLMLDNGFIDEIFCLVDLTRIQWVSPTTARMLYAAGYDRVRKVARASAKKLCEEVDRKNKEHGFFKGTIGLRDIERLIKAAKYVSQ